MRRKLLTIVAAASLMLSAATAVLWIRSYWRADVIAFRSSRAEGGRVNTRRLDALSSRARLVVMSNTQQIIPEGPPQTFVDAPHHQSQGWSFGVYPASDPFLPSKVQFAA